MSRSSVDLLLLGLVLGTLHYALARLLGMQLPFNIFAPWLLGGTWVLMAAGAWLSARRPAAAPAWVGLTAALGAGGLALAAAINGKIPTLFFVARLFGNIDLPALEPPNAGLHLAAEALLLAAGPALMLALGHRFARAWAASARPHAAYALHILAFAAAALLARAGIDTVGLVGLLVLAGALTAALLRDQRAALAVALALSAAAVVTHQALPDRFFLWSVQRHTRISETRWSPYYKLDFVSFLDQCAATICNNFFFYYTCADPMLDHQQRRKIFDVVAKKRETVLIIGSSTGIAMQTIRRADPDLRLGVGVEVDPITVAQALGPLAPYNGDVFHDPRVEVHAAEGRRWMDQETRRFDLVFLDGIDNRQFFLPASTLAIESYVFTAEGLARGLDLLDEGGVLAMDVGGTAIEAALPFVSAFGPDVTYDLYWYVVTDYPMVGLPLFFIVASRDAAAVHALRAGLEAIDSIERVEPPSVAGVVPPTDARPFIYNYTEAFTKLGWIPLLGVLGVAGVGWRRARRRPLAPAGSLEAAALLGVGAVAAQIALTVRAGRLLADPSASGGLVLAAWLGGNALANLLAERRAPAPPIAALAAAAGLLLAGAGAGWAPSGAAVALLALAGGMLSGLLWPALVTTVAARVRGSLLAWSGLGALLGTVLVQWAFPVFGYTAIQGVAVVAGIAALGAILLTRPPAASTDADAPAPPA